jgi:hypothetical protein
VSWKYGQQCHLWQCLITLMTLTCAECFAKRPTLLWLWIVLCCMLHLLQCSWLQTAVQKHWVWKNEMLCIVHYTSNTAAVCGAVHAGCRCNRSGRLLCISKSLFVVCAWWRMCCVILSSLPSECCIHVLCYCIHTSPSECCILKPTCRPAVTLVHYTCWSIMVFFFFYIFHIYLIFSYVLII